MHFHTRKFQPITHDLKLKKVAYLQASFIPPPSQLIPKKINIQKNSILFAFTRTLTLLICKNDEIFITFR